MSETMVTEQHITEALQRLPRQCWRNVLDYMESLSHTAGEMPTTRRWTAAELRKLPAVERDAILAQQAALMEAEYRNNPELTASVR